MSYTSDRLFRNSIRSANWRISMLLLAASSAIIMMALDVKLPLLGRY